MISFYPGPSKIYPSVESSLQEAFQSGILEMNHRSEPFMNLLAETIELLHQKLNIPTEYHICLTSSATECWEIVFQSFVKQSSHHIFNGAFGKKWYQNAIKTATFSEFDAENTIATANIQKADVYCITQNETSSGTQVSMQDLWQIKGELPADALVAIDATSSMAGVDIEWQLADIWFASVQKCFGLPAGMGIMVYSEKAYQQAIEVNDRRFYNSLLFIHDNFKKFQTPYTPNILGIFLLNDLLKKLEKIEQVADKITQRANKLYSFFKNETSLELLIQNESVRSDTVLAFKHPQIDLLKSQAKKAGIILGNGYGNHKETSFRIANFPAISDEEFEILKQFFLKI
jgi:phosphoserine aminotransferase